MNYKSAMKMMQDIESKREFLSARKALLPTHGWDASHGLCGEVPSGNFLALGVKLFTAKNIRVSQKPLQTFGLN